MSCDDLPQDIFFHRSVCDDFDALAKKQTVDFDFIAEKKGFRATHVKAIKTSEKLAPLGRFVMVKTGTPKDIRSVTGSVQVISGWYQSPEKARDVLKRKAIAYGCNVVTLLKCERKTATLDIFSGYKGTVHQYSGHALIGARSTQVEYDPDIEQKSTDFKRNAQEKLRAGQQSTHNNQSGTNKNENSSFAQGLIYFAVFVMAVLYGFSVFG